MTEHDGGRTLLIEDDAALREVVTASLERGGHRVTVAANGRAGLESLKDPALEVVLLDIESAGAVAVTVPSQAAHTNPT